MHPRRAILGLLACLSLLGLPLPGAASQEPDHPAGFVYVEGSSLMLDGERFIMKGFNYYPRDYGWTSMADWDFEAVDRELALAASLEANTIRTGISWQYSTGNVNYRYNVLSRSSLTPESLQALDRLLEIADRHGLKVVLWLMDGLYPELWQPANFHVVQAHLQDLIPRYADDPRIAAWDLITDLDGTMLQPPPVGCYGELSTCTRENMLTFLRQTADTIRTLDSNHPITVGFCWPTSSLLAQEFTDFMAPQFLGADHPELLDAEYIGEPEDYGRWDELLTARAPTTDRVEAKLRWILAHMARPMPLVISEYGLPSAGEYSSPQLQEAVYRSVLEAAFLRTDVAGALNWALTDFNWPPKAYTYVPLDAPMSSAEERSFGVFDLDYRPKPAADVAAAYHASSPLLTLQTNPDELQFVFSRTFVPGPQDTRELAIAFDQIVFLSDTNTALLELDLGAPSARPYLTEGFFADEGPWESQADNFVWAGGPAKRATIQVPFPPGTARVEARALAGEPGIEVQILVDGEQIQTVSPRAQWGTFGVDLSTSDAPQAGAPMVVRGRFNLPLSSGTVALQTSTDGSNWSDRASAVPQAGRVTLSTPARAGTTFVRFRWAGSGRYDPAVSDVLEVDVAAPPSSASPTLTAASAETVPGGGEGSAGTARVVPLALGILLLAGAGGLFVYRRKSRGRRTT